MVSNLHPRHNNLKRIGKTQYKYVSQYKNNKTGEFVYQANVSKHITGFSMTYYFDNLREAALCADKYLISKGREPVNILKRKV